MGLTKTAFPYPLLTPATGSCILMKLIKANIPAIEAAFAASGKTDKTFFDPELRGFGLRLRASGRQSWICLRTQWQTGKADHRQCQGADSG